MSSPSSGAPLSAPAGEPPGDIVDSKAAGPAALRGSVLLSGGYVTTILLSLVSAPVLIRHLGIAAFGRYSTVIALVTVVTGLTDAGLVSIALREWSTRVGADRWRVMRTLLGLRIELSAAAVLIGAGFALLAGYSTTLVIGTLIAGVGMALQSIANLLTAALQGELRFGWTTMINVARQTVAVALIIALAEIGAGFVPFLAVMIPAGLVTLVVTAYVVRGRMPLWPSAGGGERWGLLRDTLPYAAAIAVNSMYFRVTIVVMSLVASARQTGYFATSFRVVEVLIGVPGLAIGTAFPIIARSARTDSARFVYATERILELALIAGGLVVLLVVLSAPFVVNVLAGAAGSPAAPVLQIQGLALISTFVAVAAGFPLLSLRRHTALLIANGGALAANVVLSLVLVPIAQARGAALSAVTAETCLAVGQLLLLLRDRRIRLRMSTLAAVAAAGLAGAAPLLIGGLHPVLRTSAGLVLYLGVLRLLGRFPDEVTQLVRSRSSH